MEVAYYGCWGFRAATVDDEGCVVAARLRWGGSQWVEETVKVFGDLLWDKLSDAHHVLPVVLDLDCC